MSCLGETRPGLRLYGDIRPTVPQLLIHGSQLSQLPLVGGWGISPYGAFHGYLLGLVARESFEKLKEVYTIASDGRRRVASMVGRR